VNDLGQRVQVGLRHTGQILTIEVDETPCASTAQRDHLITQRDHLIETVPRTRR
jgi:hypothetical protein